MQERLDHILFNEGFIKKTDRIVCAVSGGADSVVMVHLLNAIGLPIVVAHCNFMLRGNESDLDAQFVEKLCANLRIPFHSKRFDTEAFSTSNHVSIQEAARKLRYEWFEQLRQELTFDLIATAHNKTDQLETVLINQIRGTGLSGLTGIPNKRESIIRPMLSFTQKEIRQYASENKIDYRNDSSNASDKYLRNKLRHNVLPSLLDIEPNIESIVTRNSTHLQEYDSLFDHVISMVKKEHVRTTNGITFILINVVHCYPHQHIILYRLLSNTGFSYEQFRDITSSKDVGSHIQNDAFNISKDRTDYIVRPTEKNTFEAITISKLGTYHFGRKTILVEEQDRSSLKLPFPKNKCVVDRSVLHQSIAVRSVVVGDKIQPFGLTGSKLVSDVLIDNKVANSLKSLVPIFEVDQEILWVGGYCFSEKYRINPDSSEDSKVIVISIVD